MSADLRAIRERAESIRVESERLLAEESTAAAPWRATLEAVRVAAANVERKSAEPVRLGIVGEFSAGKTLLLGALLGHADGLPISEDPTTGNITAVHLVQTVGTATTEYTNHRVTFLTREEFVECLGFMLENAKQRAATAELEGRLQAALKAIRPSDETSELGKVETWCGQAWDATKNPSLRFLIRELVGFVRAFAKCGAALCETGESFAVDAATVANGLELPKNAKSIQELGFGDLPVPALSFTYRPTELSSAHIQAAFPLVREVALDALVSQGVWKFGEVDSRPFALLDFPGLGAEASGVRDLFLSLRELNRIQTILIAISSKQPGGASGSNLYDLLQSQRPGQNIRDLILVAATRFDELPLEDKRLQLEAFARPASPPSAPSAARPGLTKGARVSLDDDEDDAPPPKAASSGGAVAAFLKEYSVLGTCVSGAEALVPADRGDRVLLISAMAHVKFLRDNNESFSVASEAFLDQYHGVLEKAAQSRSVWAGVTDRLVAESPSTDVKARTLLNRLAEFGIDGGVGLLRKQMLSHVGVHGREQLVKDVTAIYERDLAKALEELKGKLPPRAATDHALPEDLLQRAVAQLREINQLLMAEKRSLANSPRLIVHVEDRAVDLEDQLTEEVVFRVADWPQWERLFSSSRDGYIDPAKVRRGGPLDDDIDGDDEVVGCPHRSEDFFPKFEELVGELELFTLGLLERGLDEWVARIGRATTPIRGTLDEPLRKKDLAAQLKQMRLGERGRGLLNALKAVVDPSRMKGIFLPNEGGVAALPVTKANPMNLFPLARGSAARVFGWAPDNARLPDGSRPDRNLSHLAMALRLKEEITAIVLQQMQQLLSEGMQLIVGGQPNPEQGGRDGGMLAGLDAINERVAFAAGNSFLLDTLLRPSESVGRAAPADPTAEAVERLAASRLAT